MTVLLLCGMMELLKLTARTEFPQFSHTMIKASANLFQLWRVCKENYVNKWPQCHEYQLIKHIK